jgi:hypothetical protein
MVRIFQHQGFWILIKNFRLGEAAGGRAGSVRATPAFDSWTGDAWTEEPSMAKRFKTREEADGYLNENRARVEK